MVSVQKNDKPNDYKYEPAWLYITLITFVHIFGPHGLYLTVVAAQWKTILYATLLYYCGLVGVTAGAHRLWGHRSFKAKLPLQILLVLFQSTSGQTSIYRWARDHRLHHKHTDTDADPYNASRGLFFSHIGWLLIRKHPEVVKKLKDLDVSDLKSNTLVMFQSKYILYIQIIGTLILPAIVPWYFWSENFYISWNVACVVKSIFALHSTLSINSFAHAWGSRPYDKKLSATQSLFVTCVSVGEGFHNYHHAFPQDYKASEFGSSDFNIATIFIQLMEKIGWAYDLKIAPPKLIDQRASRTGDGTRKVEN